MSINDPSRTTYTDDQRQEKIDALVKAISYGLTFKQACELVGIPFGTGNKWLHRFPTFKEQVQAAKISNVEDLSAKMHTMAKAGNYQALAFLLSKSTESPFRDGRINLSDAEIEAMEKLLSLMAENCGLIPPKPTIVNPQVSLPENKA